MTDPVSNSYMWDGCPSHCIAVVKSHIRVQKRFLASLLQISTLKDARALVWTLPVIITRFMACFESVSSNIFHSNRYV